MNYTQPVKKITVPDIVAMKGRGEKISALTAYDYLMATLLDEAGLDLILVGDSGAMVFAGHENTIPFTMEEALYHSRAASRGVKHALLVADMPFLSYQVRMDDAVTNAGRFFKETGVQAVKVEGGRFIADTVYKMVNCGMPVMGHLGLRPQSVHQLGGYRVQAKSQIDGEKLLDDAKSLQDAGVFSLVLEKIPASLAEKVTQALSIPTIGIGAGPHCDGQVLVTQDMLGMYDKFRPKFVRIYAELGKTIRQACTDYTKDVKDSSFPSENESF